MTPQGIGYNPLNLAVDGAKLLRRPSLHFFHRGGIEAEQKTFT